MTARFFLYRRNGVYYFRWSIPRACVLRMPAGSPTEVRISLRTSHGSTARHLAAKHWLASLEATQRLLVAQNLISYNKVMSAITEHLDTQKPPAAKAGGSEARVTLGQLLCTAELQRLHDALAILDGANAELFVAVPPTSVTVWGASRDEDGDTKDEIVAMVDDFADPHSRLTRVGITDALSAERNRFLLRECWSDQSGMWRGDGTHREHLRIQLDEPLACNVSSIMVAEKWRTQLQPVSATRMPMPSNQAADCDPILLSLARDTWERDNSRAHRGTWTTSTVSSYTSTVSQFIDIVGDKLTTELTANDFTNYEKLMRRLPFDWAMTRKRTGQTVEQIAMQGGDKAKVAAKTLSDKGIAIGAFFSYLHLKGYWHNRYGGKLFAGVDQTKKGPPRHTYSNEELRRLFVGAGLPEFEQAAFPLYVWGSIVLLYTGARAAEISQLRRRDVRQDSQGCWYVQITETDDNDDGRVQAVKNDGSIREVPLHPVVLELGFLNFIDRIPAEACLFPEAFRHRQKTSREIGDWFNQKLLVTAGLKKRGVVLHGLRHTVINRFKGDATLDHLACAYTGHSTTLRKIAATSNQTFRDQYGNAFEPANLAAKLHPLLDFGIDWEPIKGVLARKGWR